jgi:hypothetical protein
MTKSVAHDLKEKGLGLCILPRVGAKVNFYALALGMFDV